jgi:uncharacterized protein (UPF0261 family)
MSTKTILVIGTYDTKNDELEYISDCIRAMGGNTLKMDVSVLGDPEKETHFSKHDVTSAAGRSIKEAIDSGSEHIAMNIMSNGAVKLANELYLKNKFHGVIILGGTMGTDLALDVCHSLPLGLPKYVVSTVSFSPIIPAERLSPDIQMILWAGGLYGLNSVCKSSLSQAAGAVLGATKAVEAPKNDKAVIGITSLGTSCLKYITRLKPELESRGYEVAIFHAMGMGGMAFEGIAAKNGFACVMDFAGCELGNLLYGSIVHAGKNRMLSAGRARIPQIVAPGCMDLIDFAGWQEIPENFEGRHIHVHNKLIQSTIFSAEERIKIAKDYNNRLSKSKAPVHLIIPNKGIEEWDRIGGDAYDPDGLKAFINALKDTVSESVNFTEIDAHINDTAFTDKALEIFDKWVEDGTVSNA